MAVEWVKVGTDVIVGGGIGAGDQLVQNFDEKRMAEKPVGIMAQVGTYYNYGIPILAILGAAMGWLRGDWATRAVTAGSQLAGRKVTKQVTKKAAVPWMRNRQLEAANRARLEAARAGAGARAGGAGVGIEF